MWDSTQRELQTKERTAKWKGEHRPADSCSTDYLVLLLGVPFSHYISFTGQTVVSYNVQVDWHEFQSDLNFEVVWMSNAENKRSAANPHNITENLLEGITEESWGNWGRITYMREVLTTPLGKGGSDLCSTLGDNLSFSLILGGF